MFNKVILIGRLGQNAEAKTAQNNREYVVLNIATQESWKNDKGEYETRTEGTASTLGRACPSSPGHSRKANSSLSKEPCGVERSKPKGSPSNGSLRSTPLA